MASRDSAGKVFLCPAEAGAGPPRQVMGLEAGERPIQWSADGRFLYTHRAGELPAKIWRLELAAGRKELLKELSPHDPAGVTSIEAILLTPDAKAYAYGYARNLSDLYIIEGLK